MCDVCIVNHVCCGCDVCDVCMRVWVSLCMCVVYKPIIVPEMCEVCGVCDVNDM